MNATTYPVHVEATLDAGMTRWLWLVKWLLVIPHYVILVFLWLTFALLSIAAFFAILFTGRYPRVIFDFNVGVLRWSWRVAYYAYSALGTDRYPPFSLAEVADYPAHLDVEYPEHLSRGLVLVKWWLLAIPHYLVVAFFVGGSGIFASYTFEQGGTWVAGTGLIGLLVVIAAVVLLFTGRYPQQIFDFVLGLNRWVLRVAAYASLMTDDYPPFRLDMGGHDPGAARVGGAAVASPSGAAQTWTTGRVVSVVVGSVLFIVAGGLLTGGTTLAVADQTLRDDRGFFMTPDRPLATGGYAIVSEPFQLDAGAASLAPSPFLGEIQLSVTSETGAPVFLGIASSADAEAYLSGVQHATLAGLETVDGVETPLYREQSGGAPATAPGDVDIWATSVSGTGEQSLSWDVEAGDWTLVMMNADGSRDVAGAAAVGATFPALAALVAFLLVGGGLLLLVALGLIIGALVMGRKK